MDFNRNLENECDHVPMNVNDIATVPVTEVVVLTPTEQSERLHKVKQRVKNAQRRMTNAFLDLADEIKEVEELVPAKRLKAFLASECAINRTDVSTYLNFSTAMALDEHRELIKKSAVSFSVVKALVAASPNVRDSMMGRLASGVSVHSGDIAASKRRLREEAKDPRVEQERRRQKAIRQAVEKKAQSTFESFVGEFMGFAQRLIDFYNEEPTQVSLAETRERLKQEAGQCARQFELLFDTTALPAPWEYNYHANPDEAVRLARAYDGLSSLARGEFQEWDFESGNPYDRSHDYLDRVIVESVIWLFDDSGISDSQLKQRRVPAAVSVPKLSKPPRQLTSIEVCAGAGGQAIGLHAAGFSALGIYERDKNAVKTLNANYPLGPVHEADIKKVDFTPYQGKVDLVAGGVPCQGHSSIGNRRGRDDERDLFLEAVRIVAEVRPRAFFFENVEGFKFQKNAAYRAELHQKFAALGYENQVFSFYGKDYGLAQGRPRVAFIGFRDGSMSRFRMPQKFTEEWRTTVGEALLDLVAANGWEHAEKWAKKANKIGPTVLGGSELTGMLAFASHRSIKEWDDLGVDPTRIASSAPPAGFPEGAKIGLTMKMGARLQGFPDDWEFQGGERAQKRQIGNALPPIMARAVGLAIYNALTGIEFDIEKALKERLLPERKGLWRLGGLSGASLDGEDWQ